MSLRFVLRELRRRWLFVLVMVAVGTVASYTRAADNAVYTARSTVYVGSRVAGDGSLQETVAEGSLDRFVATFAKMADSPALVERVLSDSGLRLASGRVVATTRAVPEPFTQLLHIEAVDANPQIAQRLASALAEAFVLEVQDYESFDPQAEVEEGSLPFLPAYVFETARLPTTPERVLSMGDLAVGAAVGLVGALATSLVVSSIDVTLRSEEDAEVMLGLPVLGAIPATRRAEVEFT